MRTLIIILCLAVAFWMASCNIDQAQAANVVEPIDSNLVHTELYGYDVYTKTVVDKQGCTWVLTICNGHGASLNSVHSPCCKNPNHAK